MNSDRTGSAAASAATSPSRRPPATGSEADFLAHQIPDAKAAMGHTLHQIADSLKESADPRGWTAEYPWFSLGAAAAVGFLLASAVTPSRDETLQERLRSLMPEKPAQPDGAQAAAAASHKSRASALLIHPLLNAVKHALIGAVASAVTARFQQEPEEVSEEPAAWSPAQTPADPVVAVDPDKRT